MPQKNKIPTSFSIKILWANLRFYDRLTLGYLWLTWFFVVLSPKPIAIRGRIMISHLLISLAIIGLIYLMWAFSRTVRHRSVYRWFKPLRDLYPFFLFTFVLFGEFTYLANLIFPYWIERYLIDVDLWLFKQPAHHFIQHHVPAWALEVMAFAYWSYYPIIAYVVLRFYLGRVPARSRMRSRQPQVKPAFLDFVNRICLSFYVCYVLFMLLPARSPRHALDLNGELHLAGGIFFYLISHMQNYVSVVGAAFPSSHVAVAWVAVMALRHDDRYIFFILVPVVVALTFSVFILQYHYVLDAIAGAFVAWLVEWFWRKRTASATPIDTRNVKLYATDVISDDCGLT